MVDEKFWVNVLLWIAKASRALLQEGRNPHDPLMRGFRAPYHVTHSSARPAVRHPSVCAPGMTSSRVNLLARQALALQVLADVWHGRNVGRTRGVDGNIYRTSYELTLFRFGIDFWTSAMDLFFTPIVKSTPSSFFCSFYKVPSTQL